MVRLRAYFPHPLPNNIRVKRLPSINPVKMENVASRCDEQVQMVNQSVPVRREDPGNHTAENFGSSGSDPIVSP